MRRKREQYAGTASKRRQIIRAALSCFVETGFVDTTMEDIRAKSKASNGSIYHHFKSKEQLAAAVYLEGIRDYQKGLIEEIRKHDEARRGVRAIVRYHLNWVDGNRVWARYLFTMRHADFMKASEDAISKCNRELGAAFKEWAEEQMDKGSLRRMPMDLFVSIILGPCQEYASSRLARGPRSDIRRAIEALGESAWRALKA